MVSLSLDHLICTTNGQGIGLPEAWVVLAGFIGLDLRYLLAVGGCDRGAD